jgi:predicted nucleotide-binding protein
VPPRRKVSDATTAGKAAPVAKATKPEKQPPAKRRGRLLQSDVPAFPLDEAMRVAEALQDYGGAPTRPLDVATALGISPSSSQFIMLTSAATAYGVTEGSSKSEYIALSDLGRRIVAPTEEGDDLRARREALLRPRIVREFLERYDGKPLPSDQIAKNVLVQLGVPPTATDRTLELVLTNAEALGLLVQIKGKRYVRLDASPSVGSITSPMAEPPWVPAADAEDDSETYVVDEAPPISPPASPLQEANNRVFVTHGRNTDIVEQIKKILRFGKFDPVVSVERQSTAKPVPDKVMDDMRGCSAGIMHVSLERKLIDDQGNEYPLVNQNVLIEIGAAMALYGRRFVLLVEKGVSLPSNLQGLYEVRYEGDRLDAEATMKLLEAFDSFRSESTL